MSPASKKRISAEAYEALRAALPAIVWNKPNYESFLRTALRDTPELLVGLNFGLVKREVADALVNRLAANEDRYQATTLSLMLEIARMSRFPNIEQMKDEDNRERQLARAHQTVEHLRTVTASYREWTESRDRSSAAREASAAVRAGITQFSNEIGALKDRYVALHQSTDPHERGKALELLLTDLLALFDMQPRLSYHLEREQIDGSLSFDTDDYIVEARWRKKPTGRGELDIFKLKVERKGRNALGIFVSVNPFSSDALDEYHDSSPFIVITGEDLFYVLDGRIRLDDLLRSKKRHVNETGDCYLPATRLIVSQEVG